MYIFDVFFGKGNCFLFSRLLFIWILAGIFSSIFFVVNTEEEGNIPLYRTDISGKERQRLADVTALSYDFSKPEKFETMQGGAGTSRNIPSRDSFSYPSANMTFEEEALFRLGDALFRKVWVPAPSSVTSSDGLGPLFNARACQSCHLKDGRGRPPEGSEDATSMFLRLAREPRNSKELYEKNSKGIINFPDAVYGGQLQDKAIAGLPAEGRMTIHYEEIEITLGDGKKVSLRKPVYSVSNPAYGPLGVDTTLSPRIAPPMIGLGLVEQIHPADILVLSDPEDKNGDGISGKPNIVREQGSRKITLGRFGWKAQNPTIRQQGAGAFAGDMGISTPEVPLHYGDCTEAQKECMNFPSGADDRTGLVEAPPPIMDLVTFYSSNLAVPARRNTGQLDILAGKKIFYEIGCVFCHTPKFVTRRDAPNKIHSFQLIWPYSDFLLHDMGPGLADGQAVGEATGTEWRTSPLWGIGLTKVVNGHTFFLHDGRARNLEEAILWHDGEGRKARDGFANLSKKDREKLIQFLESM